LLYQLSYRVGDVSNFACWNYLDNSLSGNSYSDPHEDVYARRFTFRPTPHYTANNLDLSFSAQSVAAELRDKISAESGKTVTPLGKTHG
jgi:hypothetical protein